MAVIPLREYCREIENLIDKGHTEEAIGHCRHILKHFPKHVETYRLLGKAYLESRQLGDASDIFQRVLSTIPEDFVSHIGMSIIREDEGNLDAAIWHMERAYEVQSSNIAIQDELKRLYAQRDGQEPAKIRLTRGALAHLYANGHLYTQAIAELRAALTTDPKRMDMLALLAKMFHADRQFPQAAKTASQLITKLPYCLIANQILADILTSSQRPAEAAIHRTRIQELDPYYKHVSSQYPSVEVVPSGLIVIEFLDWEATKGGLISQPAWATSIGVNISNAPTSEELPEWLSPALGGVAQNNTFSDTSFDGPLAAFDNPMTANEADWENYPLPALPRDEKSKPSPETHLHEANTMREEDENDNIPDWMKSAGWGSRDPNTPEEPPPSFFDDEDDAPKEEGDIAKANIPDWLKAMAPADISDEQDSAEATDLPDWLQGFNTAETVPSRVAPPATPTPSWMNTTDDSAEEADLDLPDWLQTEAPTSSPASISDEASLEKADMPDWLKGLGPSASTPAQEPDSASWFDDDFGNAPASEFKLDELEESTAPDWLQSFGDEVVSSTLPAAKKEPSIPSWLEDEIQTPEPEEASLDSLFENPSGETVHSGLSWLDNVSPEESDDPSTHSGVTDWLLDNDQASENLPTAPATEIPDWLQGLGEELPAGDAFGEEEATLQPMDDLTPSFDVHDLGKEATPTGTDFGSEDDAMAWLESLAAKQGAKEEELLTKAESRQESHLPSWLEEMTNETEEEAPLAEDIPDWLKGLTEETEPASPLLDEEISDEEFSLPGTPEEPALPDIEDAPLAEEIQDEDAAMAWLESLAAKQGAKEEELLTTPAERPDDVPDWLKGILGEEEPIVEETAISGPVTELDELFPSDEPEPETIEEKLQIPDTFELDEPAPILEEPETPVAEVAEEAPSDMLDEDAALAWLESLAMKQGVSEEELLTDSTKRPESTPDWVNIVAEEARAQEAAQMEAPEDFDLFTEELPTKEESAEEMEPVAATTDTGWLSQLLEDEEDKPLLEPTDSSPDWLTESAANWIAKTTAQTEAITPEAIEEPAPADEIEMPAWLMEEGAPAEEAEAVPSWVLDEPAETPAEPEVPAWILEEPTPEEKLEEVELPSWFAEETAEASVAVPSPAIEEVPAPAMESEPEPVIEPIAIVDSNQALSTARATLARGEVASAAAHYARLIKSNQNIDEAIADITEALNTRYPVDIDLWCSLGDAYTKKSKLQDALDAYTKAEELLR